MLLQLIFLNFLATIGASVRHKRYLVYPDGGPARAQWYQLSTIKAEWTFTIKQPSWVNFVHKIPSNDTQQVISLINKFIIGLGIPVDLKEASVTVGTVIKFQYDLPTNSSEYTSRIYGFANTVSRDMNGEPDEDSGTELDTGDARMGDTENTIDDSIEEENNTLVDLTFQGDRRKRSLVYAEGGTINTDLTESSTELSLEEAIRRQEIIDQNNIEEQEPQKMNRWDFYKILEHMAERYGYSGRPCLLRTICEAAKVPFTHENGLLAEIGHILFTPSTTKDTLSHHTDNEYHAAERFGREIGVDCEDLFPECEGSILETFTEIGEDTMHKFGLL